MDTNTMTQTGDKKKWPGDCDEAYPDVFTKPPPFPKQLKPGMLSKDQFQQFFEEGFVVVDKLFDESELHILDEARRQVENMVDDLAQKLYNAGKISDLCKDYGLFQRLTEIEKQFPGAAIILHKYPILPQGFRALWAHEKLLNITEQLLGTADISGSPVWNIRTKTPGNDAMVNPWHQDNSYFDHDMYKEMMVTAWVPLLDAVESNGCMQMARFGHQSGKIATHQCGYGSTWYTILQEDEMVKTLGVNLETDIVTCPVPYGGVLLFNNTIPHRSLANISNDIRWSLDLRWHKTEAPAGLFGQKESLPMRTSTNMDSFNIDWAHFDSVDRHQKASEDIGMEYDEFDTTIQGPHMKNWELVNRNTHTEAFERHQGLLKLGP